MVQLLAFLTGPIGRILLIAILGALLYGKGRLDQHHVDQQAADAAEKRLAAAELANVQSAGRMAARVAAAHGAAQDAIGADNDKLRAEIRDTKAQLAFWRQPTPPADSRPGKPAQPSPGAPNACPAIDPDDVLLGPGFIGLWNRALGGAVPDVPGAREPGGAVPAPAAPDRRPDDWRSRAQADPRSARPGAGDGQDLLGSGRPLDRVVLRLAEVMRDRASGENARRAVIPGRCATIATPDDR